MKDAYYFPHDSNARNDQRLIKIRMKHGMEGYGIYFGIIEILREQENYALWKSDIESVSFDLRADIEIVNDVIHKHNLFEWKFDDGKDEGYFYSASLKRRMEKLDLIKEKRAIAGAKGGKAKAIGKQLVSKEKSVKQSKEDIVNKSKVLEVKKQEFFTSVHKYSDFSKSIRDDFISYWTELNHSRTKMKFQLQKTFEIKRRLTTWKNNNFNNGKKNGYVSDADYDQQKKDARNREENKKLKALNKHIWD